MSSTKPSRVRRSCRLHQAETNKSLLYKQNDLKSAGVGQRKGRADGRKIHTCPEVLRYSWTAINMAMPPEIGGVHISDRPNLV